MKAARRILLLGTTGQVGWELLRSLQALGDVTALSRSDVDFDDPESLRGAFASKPDLVVNAVAYTAVDQAETDIDRAQRVNGTALAVLADESRKCGALLIHYSTDYVFDGTAEMPYRETDMPAPRSQYGLTKLAGEEAVRTSGCRHVILRTSWVFASRGKNFLKTILRLAAEREQLRIVSDQRGAPTSARLIAECTAQIAGQWMRSEPETFESGTYHLAASGETTWHGFATYAVERARALGVSPLMVRTIDPILTSDYPLPAPRPAYSKLATDRVVERFAIHLPDWKIGVDLCLAELHAGS